MTSITCNRVAFLGQAPVNNTRAIFFNIQITSKYNMLTLDKLLRDLLCHTLK